MESREHLSLDFLCLKKTPATVFLIGAAQFDFQASFLYELPSIIVCHQQNIRLKQGLAIRYGKRNDLGLEKKR